MGIEFARLYFGLREILQDSVIAVPEKSRLFRVEGTGPIRVHDE